MDLLHQTAEIESFRDLWPHGYFEGDPLDPHAATSYSAYEIRNRYADQTKVRRTEQIAAEEIGYLSCIYAAYIACIRPFLKRGMSVLEIDPGRGAWSKAMLRHEPSHLYALDALSAAHNGFFEYIGPCSNVTYTQVCNFECSVVPNCSIDFFFSFGVFCHISREGTKEYFRHVRDKMRSGAHGFVLISDYTRFPSALALPPPGDVENEETTPRSGRWYHIGADWFCDMIEGFGFEVLDRDTGVNVRDPVVHFRRI